MAASFENLAEQCHAGGLLLNIFFETFNRVTPVMHSAESASPSESSTPPTVHPGESLERTPQQLEEAHKYGRQELICQLTDKAIDLAFLSVAAFLIVRPLDAWLAPHIASDAWRLPVLFLMIFAMHLAVSFPLSYYSGFVLEHRYGLSRMTVGKWFWRYAKGNLLAIVFGMLTFEGLFWIIWTTHGWWWIVSAAAFFVISVVLGQLMPVLILPLFYKVERLDNPELAARMQKLAAGTGLSIEGVYRLGLSVETVKANAMLAGLGSTRRVLMGDTLLDGFTPDEIEVIFAHEIGHHVHGHITKMIAAGLVFSAVGFWICDRLAAGWIGATNQPLDYAHFPIAVLPLLMLIITVFGLIMEPLQNVISRHYERQCDRYALRRTGLTTAYRTAFRKLAKLNKDDPNPNPLAVFLFHSHPPIAQRLALADEV